MCKHRFVETEDGTDIKGRHLHIYKCSRCGLLDLGVEE